MESRLNYTEDCAPCRNRRSLPQDSGESERNRTLTGTGRRLQGFTKTRGSGQKEDANEKKPVENSENPLLLVVPFVTLVDIGRTTPGQCSKNRRGWRKRMSRVVMSTLEKSHEVVHRISCYRVGMSVRQYQNQSFRN
ncbi:hypothetical protein CEXT_687291 [Caerostris extrusa]|uniref:Uncharacterized protein n=1 Tax=Caerostris extrusa TaxID=172846 RepID=A0AAV4V634_CAEEX|nr:hypothetical protein CEXT_687291 [Caerostris extrusa]